MTKQTLKIIKGKAEINGTPVDYVSDVAVKYSAGNTRTQVTLTFDVDEIEAEWGDYGI